MLTIGFLMKVYVAIFSGWFMFRSLCAESHRQCFDVESKNICYFIPNVSLVDWDTAWKTCKELNATLPVVLSKEDQTVLETYLEEHLPRQPVWIAGRYVSGDNRWKWLNGQWFSGTGPLCGGTTGYSCAYGTQAVLTKERKYEARSPRNEFAFICSIPDVDCANVSENHITWEGRCLLWSDNNMLSLNQARNYCLKRRGDLATFSEEGDLDRLQNMRTDLQAYHGYWIGLHRKWWIWNTTRGLKGSQDIKYNNIMLIHNDDLRKDCLFLSIRSEWVQDQCSVNKSFICQRASVTTGITTSVTTGITASTITGISASVTIFVVIAVLVVVVAAVIVLIFIRRHRGKAKQLNGGLTHEETEESYQNLRHGQDNQRASDQYMELVTPQQTEVNSDYQTISDYAEVEETRAPNYIDVVQ